MKTDLLKSLSHMREGTRVALLILGDDLTVVSDFTESTISLKRAAEDQLHVRGEGFGPSITAHKTGNTTRDAMILKATSRAFRAEDDERTGRTIGALNLICDHLARIPGRKNLIWITGGLTAAGQSEAVTDEVDRLNDANVAVYTVDARGVLLDPAINAQSDTNDLTAPMVEAREESRGDVLATVATDTGGVFYRNTNRLSGAIDQALEDNAIVYVIDYYPQLNRFDGKVHKLEVKTSRPGVHLRYRSNYRAARSPQPALQNQQQMLAAAAAASLDFPGLRFSVDVRPGAGSDPTLLLHVPVEEVQWSANAGNMLGTLQVWFLQKRSSGADVFTTTWKSDLHLSNDQYQQATRAGLSLAGAVKLQPSVAKVRVVLRDAASGKIGTVDVPAESITRGPSAK
jgi:VWFA-related protein